MANTTNFGWATPDDTALVKDGASAIRTLGSSIDTSMAKLKGGTSTQVLTKNSTTDMDFIWVDQNPGDITGVTATSPITGGGTSGTVSLGLDMAAATKLAFNAQTETTYTFVLADADNKLITASNASAQTYTIPPNSSVAFPIGTQINVIQIGAGQVTFSQGAGVTIASNGGTSSAPKLRVQYSAATLIKISTDSWYVVGDIA